MAHRFTVKATFPWSRSCVHYGEKPASDVTTGITPPLSVVKRTATCGALTLRESNSAFDRNQTVNTNSFPCRALDLSSWTRSIWPKHILRRWSCRERWVVLSEIKEIKWFAPKLPKSFWSETNSGFFKAGVRQISTLCCRKHPKFSQDLGETAVILRSFFGGLSKQISLSFLAFSTSLLSLSLSVCVCINDTAQHHCFGASIQSCWWETKV